jgi:6-hydroxytryprostatin B O-methyltransferase
MQINQPRNHAPAKLNFYQSICSFASKLSPSSDTTYEAQDQLLDIKLQLSRLKQSINAACLLDEQGFWSGPPEDEILRLELQEITLNIQKMITRPVDIIQSTAQAHHAEACLRYAAHHQLALHVPLDRSITYAEVAAKACVDQSQCKRILRFLISQHIFAETPSGELCHTPPSRHLRDPVLNAWVEYQTSDSLKASTHFTEALTKWPGSAHKSETAYSLAHGTNLPMFEHIASVGKLERFRKAMSGMAYQPSFSADHAIAAYAWQDLPSFSYQGEDINRRPVVVDVGGGIGHVALAIHDAYPLLDVRVQDIGVSESHSKNNVHFSAYNFFDLQPIKNADAYLLRQILHDWPDDSAVRILQNQIAAMGRHTRLIIMDIVLQAPEQWNSSDQRKSRMMDIAMLTLFNARERELHEWIDLVKQASDSRLVLTHLARPTGSLLSVMEFSFAS